MNITKQKQTHIYIYKERKLAVTSGERSGKEEQDRGVGLRYRSPCIKKISTKDILGGTGNKLLHVVTFNAT